MSKKVLKTKQDCIDFLTGLKLLGTGGGGFHDDRNGITDQSA
jgi:DUF917 family protein